MKSVFSIWYKGNLNLTPEHCHFITNIQRGPLHEKLGDFWKSNQQWRGLKDKHAHSYLAIKKDFLKS